VLLGLVMVVSAAVFVLVLLSAFVSGGESDAFVREAGSGAPADPSDPGAQPVDPDDFRAVMEDNTLYNQGGLRQRDCVATDLDDADTGDQERYYSRLMGCLDEEWGTLIESAGYAYDTPQLVVFDDEIATPCGNAAPRDGRTLAFYCPTDAVLYADAPQMARFFGEIEMAYAVVIGHEFGHHVQNEVGILVAYDDAVYARFSDRFELSRRVELQASCMSGLFLGAVAATYPISETDFSDLQQVSLSFGDETGAQEDERDHGSGQSNQEWILTAFDTNDTAVCNTFAAPDGAVD
jgi:predicted metalloprotease